MPDPWAANGMQWGGPAPGGAAIPAGYVAPPMQPRPAASMEICRKKNESLKKFSGNLSEFQIWRDRMVDHISRDNHRWRSLLENLQAWQTPITREWLLTQSECGVNAWELSVKLEAFLVDHMSDTFY